MILTSKKVTVQKSAEGLCEYLSDVKNFEQLMPENTTKFEVTGDESFVFALKGMPEIGLTIKEKNPPNQLVLGASDDKIPFNLTGNIEAVSETSSEIELVFDGQFNTMMAMMIKGPISKFLETLVTNMEKL